VLALTGAQHDRTDPAKWHTAQGVLSIRGAKFMNWTRSCGGGGAIDLVIHLESLDFKAAVEWLWHRFPHALPSSCAPCSVPRRRLELSSKDPARLGQVLHYLVHERGLPHAMLVPLLDAGDLYADSRGNAVFLMRAKQGQSVGAEIRGTTSRPWKAMAPGSRKDLGYFSVSPPHAHQVVLCESAIDALSCFLLKPGSACISTAGARPDPHWLASLLVPTHKLYCGFDADPTGDAMARAMIEIHPQIERMRPPLKDWNDLLMSKP
jgi:hypothetical protein